MTRVSFLAAALALSACAARAETFGSSIPGGGPPPLPPGAQVPFYDHYCSLLTAGRDAEDAFSRLLDDASNAGWEMVSAATYEHASLFCFKRPRATPGAAPGA
jgi:hypothetical protein